MDTPRRKTHHGGALVGYIVALGLAWLCLFGPWNVLGTLQRLLPFLGFAFGVLCGFAVAVVAGTLWVGLAGPAQEWFLERFIDPPQPSNDAPAAPPQADGGRGVLVSDLHIDTWQYSDGGPSERERRFLDLLDAVKSDKNVNSFYLNGDLMDAPLHPDANKPEPLMLQLSAAFGQEQGVLLTRYDAVLGALLNLSLPGGDGEPPLRRAIFQTGNHDLGISGLRYVRPDMPKFLPAVQTAWNPSLLLQTDAQGRPYDGGWVYIEHGHHWDPLLWLYMRYALLDVLRAGHNRREAQMLSGMQRGGKKGMGSQTLVPGSALLPTPAPGVQKNHYLNGPRGFQTNLVLLRYRHAARRTFRQFAGPGGDPVRTVIFGHTHLPDRYVFPGNKVYVNSGDWSGLSPHCTYCVLEPDGSVRGPFQWESQAKSEFAPRPA